MLTVKFKQILNSFLLIADVVQYRTLILPNALNGMIDAGVSPAIGTIVKMTVTINTHTHETGTIETHPDIGAQRR